jgi:hypothetical protein
VLPENCIFTDGEKRSIKVKVNGNRIEGINKKVKWREPKEYREETKGEEDWY